MKAITIGMDIAKSVFQVHVEDGEGRVIEQRRLRRSQVEAFFARQAPAVVGIEACGSSHYWGRRLQALGHEVRLIPASYVKPFVRRNKTDARDAAAICVAVKHPDMRFVPVKSAEQQAARALERSRELLVRQHTQLSNSIRSQLAEHGLVAVQGRRGMEALKALVAGDDERIPATLKTALTALITHMEALASSIAALDKEIVAAVRADPAMRRLTTVPGIGPQLAHTIVSAIGDGRRFASARAFAAWVGLTPRGDSTAGKVRNKGISRQGDARLRTLFTLGASTVMRYARVRGDRATAWQRGILARARVKVAVVAQAARTARIAWAVLTSGQPYRRPDQAPAPKGA